MINCVENRGELYRSRSNSVAECTCVAIIDITAIRRLITVIIPMQVEKRCGMSRL